MTGIIASDGGYIVASNSMRSSSFTEYIRGSNLLTNMTSIAIILNVSMVCRYRQELRQRRKQRAAMSHAAARKTA